MNSCEKQQNYYVTSTSRELQSVLSLCSYSENTEIQQSYNIEFALGINDERTT